jgi:hypothetical protein
MTVIYVDRANDQSYSHNFVAPEGSSLLNREVLFPLAEVKTPAYAATLAVTVKQMDTFLQPAELTGNATINLTIDAQVTAGAKLHLKLDADSTARVVTLGTGFDAAAADITVPAAGVLFMSFVYDGTSFVAVSSADARLVTLEGTEKLTPAYAATLAVTIAKKETFLQPAELTGAATINLTIGAAVPVGSKLHLKLDADGTNRTVTLGTGFDAGLGSIVVKASSIAFMTFTYDGTAFVPSVSIPV